MEPPGRPRWLWTAFGIGIVYLVVGLVIAELAGAALSTAIRVRWRLAAWLISGAVFVAQIAHERLRLRTSSRSASFHAALAAAIGAFALAVAATVHKVAGGSVDVRYALALVAWPAVTAVPAFIVAFVLSSILRPGRSEEGGGQ
jgi:hypothetical protein